MGILDWLRGGKRKGRSSTSRPIDDTTSSESTGTKIGKAEQRILTDLQKELTAEKEKSRDAEHRIKEMEDNFSTIQAQWVKMMEKQQDAITRLMSEKEEPVKKEKLDEAPVRSPPADIDAKAVSREMVSGVVSDTKPRRKRSFTNAILSEKTFRNFVVDDSNRFAYLATEAVATGVGRKYNPLFVYGPPGVGKTHLLHALANSLVNKDPDINILYSSTERFTDELVDAIENDDIQGFRSRYRDLDVLLVDDIQMLSGKETTQMEFFNMFNHLYHREKQIVLCSDRPPAEIKELESRLRSRFEGGLIIDIKVPTFEGRRQILFNLSQKDGFSLSSEVLDYMAFYLDSNVRELEGGFNRVTAYASLMKEPITVSLVRKVLEGVLLKREKGRIADTGMEPGLLESDESAMTQHAQTVTNMDLEEETDQIERELLSELRKQTSS
ncbi:MAG: chromosomal replication initiator protein DnaA [Thermoplasmatota archaeon]